MNIKRLSVLAVIAALAFNVAAKAHADEGTYFAAIGAGAGVSPDYQGSDDYSAGVMPFLSLGWQSATVAPSGGTGLQLGLHDITLNLPQSLEAGLAKYYRPEGTYKLSAGVSYNAGRDASDNDALNGMGDIDGHFLGSLAINFAAKDSGWLYGVRYTGSDDNGSQLAGRLGYAYPLTDDLVLTPALHASWADDKYMQTNFGVSQQQANASTNSKFDAGSGLKSTGLGAELGWTLSESWMMNANLGYTRLTGDAANSPLVKNQGSANQFTTSIALIYSF